MQAAIERRVREAWEDAEGGHPGQQVWAMVPVSRQWKLGDVPNLPDCERVEIKWTGPDVPITLVFLKRRDWA